MDPHLQCLTAANARGETSQEDADQYDGQHDRANGARPCSSSSPTARARRPELSDEAQSCDFLAEEKELGTGQLPACATS
jgi:hypothetical protein